MVLEFRHETPLVTIRFYQIIEQRPTILLHNEEGGKFENALSNIQDYS